MTPEAAIVLAERILALGEGTAAFIEHVVTAVEERHPDKAAYYARLAGLGAASGAKASLEAAIAGRPAKS